MNVEITNEQADSMLSTLLKGCYINQVVYHITGWELRLTKESLPQEIILLATEIKIPDENLWWKNLKGFPIDLTDTNDAEDTLVAMALFTVMSKWPISQISINKTGDLTLGFENGCTLCVEAVVEGVDWTWQLDDINRNNIIICDSSALYGDPAYFSS